ncbi:MAG: response regulator [Pseudomonadota bacterium]
MSPSTILIVEDEPKIAALLADYLEQNGFGTHWLSRGNEVLAWVERHQVDLILLDLMLPEKDGITVCREVRERSRVPIIMVTARADEVDRLLGLEIGADDYICKPFSPREVVARVKAVLRRLKPDGLPPESGYAGVVLDTERLRVSANGETLDLTRVECRLLEVLLMHPGRIFSRAQLMDVVYEDGRIVSDRTMDTHVKNLRRKLEQVVPGRDLIHSVYGAGYRLE